MADPQISKELQQKIGELQMIQQRLTVLGSQKQQLQIQQIELDNALAELNNAKPPVYKMTGEILIEQDPSALKKSLGDNKSDIDVRLASFEKQEEREQTRAKDLQQEITKDLK